MSRHPKKPTDKLKFDWEIKQIRHELSKVRKLVPNATWRWRIGNHEAWLQRYLNTVAPELSLLDDLKLSSLLRFSDFKIEEIPEGTREKIGKLWHLHGHEVACAGKYPARSLLLRLHANVIAGHVHKFDMASERDYKGDLHTCWTNAACVPLTADWAHHTDWHLGFTEIQYAKGGFFNVAQIPIHQEGGVYFASYNGRIFEAASDQAGEIVEMPIKRQVSKAVLQASKQAAA